MSKDGKRDKPGDKNQLKFPFASSSSKGSDFSIRRVVLRKAPREGDARDSSTTAALKRPPEPQSPPRPDPRKSPIVPPSIEDCGIEALKVQLDPERHPSLRFSCADNLLWLYADQIVGEKELAVAYPCLNCRGGLSLFLAYIALAVEWNPPGRMPDPVLVYPGTAEIREAYVGLQIKVGDLLTSLRKRRVKAYAETKKGGFEYPWEKKIRLKIKNKEMTPDHELPLHAFFPAAVLDGEGAPKVFAGRDGLGRGDDAPPPLHFATRIEHVFPKARYRAAFLMHDALTSRAERKRLFEGVSRIKADSVIHLFESPFSPTFRRTMRKGTKFWRIRQEDFPPDGELFLSKNEILEMLDTTHRIHELPCPLGQEDMRGLIVDLRRLRKQIAEKGETSAIYSDLYGIYRLLFTLPVPVDDYDTVAEGLSYSPAEELVSDAMGNAEILGPGLAHSLADDSGRRLLALLERLKKDPARPRALLTEAKRSIRDGKTIGIVVTNHVMDSAIERFLARELECDTLSLQDKGIHIVRIGNLRAVQRFDTLLFTGYRGGTTLRWIMSGHGREVVVLATESERKEMRKDLDEATGGKDTWKPRMPKGPMTPIVDKEPGKELREKLGETRPDLPSLPLDEDLFIRGLMDYVPSQKPEQGHPLTGPQKCLKVVFSRRYAFLPADGFVTVVGTRETKEKRVKDLAEGDVVLFINRAQSRTIYDLMLEEIRKLPEFTEAVGWIQAYHRRLGAAFRDSDLSYAGIHRRMEKLGTDVVEATVASWIRGKVMAPLESENLGRIFKVFEIDDPDGTISAKVDGSARKLRTVYRQYARAVNAFLIKSAADDRPEIDDLLEKHRLDIGAVRESVYKETVEDLLSDVVDVPFSLAGRLHDR